MGHVRHQDIRNRDVRRWDIRTRDVRHQDIRTGDVRHQDCPPLGQCPRLGQCPPSGRPKLGLSAIRTSAIGMSAVRTVRGSDNVRHQDIRNRDVRSTDCPPSGRPNLGCPPSGHVPTSYTVGTTQECTYQNFLGLSVALTQGFSETISL